MTGRRVKPARACWVRATEEDDWHVAGFGSAVVRGICGKLIPRTPRMDVILTRAWRAPRKGSHCARCAAKLPGMQVN